MNESCCPIKPLRNEIIFVREAEEEGILMIPDNARRPSLWGQVHAVGKDVEELTVGDRVLVDLWQGTELDYGARVYWRIDEERVLATDADSW